MKLGAHVPIGKSLDAAVDNASLIGCETMQIFTSNPKGWNFTVRGREEIERFKEKAKNKGITDIFGHSIYLINLATENPYVYTNSINSLISGLTLAENAGFSGVVTHVGSHVGAGYETGIKQVVNALIQTLATTKEKIPILLETDAGSGNKIGCKFSDIAEIISKVDSGAIRVCLDTCHIFASGYDIRSKAGLNETLEEFDREIGLEKLALIHLNDSKGDLGSNIDRHEIIGEGKIGLESFGRIINHPKLKHLPGIVETPDNKTLGDENVSLERLRKLRKE
ncbi:MAG: deoxyribonuclease IV [Patescibacteria group bacterium]|nr:deoxyribonuclease IV [Patescibacteria group bacterium]